MPVQPTRMAPLNASLIHEFPNPTWIENLFVRSNGDILLTSLSLPHLYVLNPYEPQSNPILIHVREFSCSKNVCFYQFLSYGN